MDIAGLLSNPHFIGWGLGIPLSYVTICFTFRALNLWPEKLAMGTRGSDYMTFDIVAGSCLTFFGIVGSISWLDLCDGGWSYRLLEVDKFYGNASFVQNYLIIPIMFYQFWNTILCLILPDIRDPVMIVHHILTGLLAYCATYPFACYYALFFFGLSETTQLPLTIVDVLDHFPSIRNNHPFVDALSKNLFGAMFFLVRIVLWTKVSVEFWAGCLDLLHQPHVHDKLVVMFMLLSNVILTGMQYLWAIKIGKIAIFGGEIQEKKVE